MYGLQHRAEAHTEQQAIKGPKITNVKPFKQENQRSNLYKKGEGLVPLERLIPLQMFVPVLSQESDVQKLSFVYVIYTCFSFLVFLYRLDRWFSRLNGFTLVLLGPFIACCSV